MHRWKEIEGESLGTSLQLAGDSLWSPKSLPRPHVWVLFSEVQEYPPKIEIEGDSKITNPVVGKARVSLPVSR